MSCTIDLRDLVSQHPHLTNDRELGECLTLRCCCVCDTGIVICILDRLLLRNNESGAGQQLTLEQESKLIALQEAHTDMDNRPVVAIPQELLHGNNTPLKCIQCSRIYFDVNCYYFFS